MTPSSGVLPERNLVPGRYRGVAVARVGVELTAEALVSYFVGREVYRRTRFVVARNGPDTAVLRVEKPGGDNLFQRVTRVDVLALPSETRYVVSPQTDTAIPSGLAEAALRLAPGVRAVVVEGRYQHVSLIIGPDPLRVVVREIVPPRPAKLFDQAQRLLDIIDALPPMTLVPEVVDVERLAEGVDTAAVLMPCRGSGGDVAGMDVRYLDERPEQTDWTLIGCARSRQIHQWFYGSPAPGIDLCPFSRPEPDSPTLTKCCMQEEHVAEGPSYVSVPWGSSLDQVREALFRLARRWEPTWAPV
jgi:hypothetical protein